jgi:hypothetical protein
LGDQVSHPYKITGKISSEVEIYDVSYLELDMGIKWRKIHNELPIISTSLLLLGGILVARRFYKIRKHWLTYRYCLSVCS